MRIEFELDTGRFPSEIGNAFCRWLGIVGHKPMVRFSGRDWVLDGYDISYGQKIKVTFVFATKAEDRLADDLDETRHLLRGVEIENANLKTTIAAYEAASPRKASKKRKAK